MFMPPAATVADFIAGGGPTGSSVALVTLNFENLYCTTLELLITRYVQPLRKWGLIDKVDLAAMFGNVGDLHAASKHHLQVLKKMTSSVDSRADTADISGDQIEEISRLFISAELFEMYQSYAMSYPQAKRALELCLQKHEPFGTFLNLQQRSTHSTLESLLLQPIARIPVYADVLRKVLECLPDDHQHRSKLSGQQQRWADLGKVMATARQARENAERLVQIELSFPHDRLNLASGSVGDDDAGVKRRWSAPPIIKEMSRKVRGVVRASSIDMRTEVQDEYARLEPECAEPPEIPSGENGTPGRVVLKEGELFEGSKRRVVYLLSDQLLVAKPKAKGLFTLRLRLWLAEAWVEIPARLDSTFALIVGSPFHRRLLLLAPTEAAQTKWANALQSAIAAARRQSALALPKEIVVYPIAADCQPEAEALAGDVKEQSTPLLIKFSSDPEYNCRDVCGKVLELWADRPPGAEATNFTLYELTTCGLLMLEHYESPAAIQAAGRRCNLHRSRCQFVMRLRSVSEPLHFLHLPESLACLVTNAADSGKSIRQRQTVREGSIAGSPPSAQQSNHSAAIASQAKDKKKGGVLSKYMGTWRARVKQGKGSSNVSGYENPIGAYVPYTFDGSAALTGGDAADGAKSPGLLYGRPLSDLLQDGCLPLPLQNMIGRLYHDGPAATGLFRKSANARVIRQVRERLDAGLEVDFLELPILAVGAILKEFLRSLPDSVLTLEMYDEFVATNSVPDEADRTAAVISLLDRLPPCHMTMLSALIPMFVQICDSAAENSMSASNIGICIGQSLMWPPQTDMILRNDVPPFIEFVITHAEDLFAAPMVKFDRPESTVSDEPAGTDANPGTPNPSLSAVAAAAEEEALVSVSLD